MKRALLLLALAACDHADPASYEDCVKSHTEMKLEPTFGMPSPLGIKVGNGFALRPVTVCDERATFECKGWTVDKLPFDGKHTRCTEYQRKEQ